MSSWYRDKLAKLNSFPTADEKVRFLINSLKEECLVAQHDWLEDELADICDETYFFLSRELLKEAFDALHFSNEVQHSLFEEMGLNNLQ